MIKNNKKYTPIVIIAAVVLRLCVFAMPAGAASMYSASPDVVIPGQTEVTIKGSGFGSSQSGQSIYFGNARVSEYQYWSNDEIRVVIPTMYEDGDKDIKLCYRNSFFTYSCDKLATFRFYFRPRITAVSESYAPVGETIAIYGYNFGFEPGTVYINGKNAQIFEWKNHWFSLYGQVIKAKVPDGTASGHIVVTSKNGYASETWEMTEFKITYPSLVSGSGETSADTDPDGIYGAPTSIALFRNDGKLITDYLPMDNKYVSEHPIVKFDWKGAFSDSGIAGYFVEFTDKKAADPVQTGRFQSTAEYRAYNFAPNEDYTLFVRSIDRDNNISDTKYLTYRLEQPASQISQSLTDRLRGYILIQVDSMGEAWYVHPEDGKKYYLNRPADAFRIMRDFGLGVANADLDRIPEAGDFSSGDKALVDRLRGKILLQVEGKGEAWYVNPADGKRYYLGNPEKAFGIMRDLGLGITDANLNKIQVGDWK